MSQRAILLSAAACAALVAIAAVGFRMGLERALLLAPVLVVTAGATLFLFVLWTKVALESLRRQRHPYRIVAGGVAALAALVVLSFFVDLPRAH